MIAVAVVNFVDAAYTVKISVYPRMFCGEFSILYRNRFRVRLHAYIDGTMKPWGPRFRYTTENSQENMRPSTDIFTVYRKHLQL